MVLSQRHSHAHVGALQQAISRIEPTRVLGIAGAITLNLTALMLLMVPVSAPITSAPKEDIIIYERAEKIVPPPPPIEVPVVRPPTTQTTIPTRTHPPVTQPTFNQEVIVPDGSEYVEPAETPAKPEIGPTLPSNPDPLPSTRLEYASAPAPAYPREALMGGIEGTVVLKVLVDVDGKPISVEIERSSGNRKLDDAARRQVLRKWMFRPAIRNGQAVQVYGIVPVNFTLSLQ